MNHLLPADSEVIAADLAAHCLPISIKESKEFGPHLACGRATMTLLQVRERHFFVTCAHVFTKLEETQEKYPEACLAAYIFKPQFMELHGFQLVERGSKSIDVAVFREQEERCDLPSVHWIDYERSLLQDPQIGEMVCIVGYPSQCINVTPGIADFGYMQLLFPISSISERHVVLADETGGRKCMTRVDSPTGRVDITTPLNELALGGLSGAPAFVMRGTKFRFLGIVTDSHHTDHTILIARLGYLKSNGKFDWTRMPPDQAR